MIGSISLRQVFNPWFEMRQHKVWLDVEDGNGFRNIFRLKFLIFMETYVDPRLRYPSMSN
jgi:hypothetical protein